MKIRKSGGERAFLICTYAILFFAIAITLYPFVYVFSMSISDPIHVSRNEIVFLPKGFSLEAYKKVIANKEFYTGYYNTVWYTVVGTVLNVLFTLLAAYPLARKHFFARKFFSLIFLFTMFFGGGMIPSFLLVSNLGLYNTRWAIILPGLISTWNMVLCRTFIQSLPEELFDSANIDGCTDFRFIPVILIPLIRPILSVLTIYYGVDHWNSWFSALLYLTNDQLLPVQIYLRRLVLQASNDIAVSSNYGISGEATLQMIQIRYTAIFAICVPIMMIYPFFQKHFTKGVMIGALKG